MRHTREPRRAAHLALSLVLAVFSTPAPAATIVVDETGCTLIDAIRAANTDSASGGCPAGSGPDTITLTTDVTLTAPNDFDQGPTGLPGIDSDVTIEGGGFTIERAADAPPFRLMLVKASGDLSLSNATLTNGQGPGGTWPVNAGGAILSLGSLTLSNSTLSANTASHGGGLYVFSGSETNLFDSVLSANSTSHSYGSGGAVAVGGTLNMTNSTLSDNSATGRGGGIYAIGTVVVTSSTLSYNDANRGGGFYLYGATLNMTNSTVSGNTGDGDAMNAYAGTAFLTGSTFTSNSAGAVLTGSIGSAVSLAACVVANEGGPDCSGGSGLQITDLGSNFSSDDSCGPGFTEITPGMDFDTTLADNGGPTLTHALFPWSVAIDAAGDCGLETDQRGFPRDDGVCDSGSFEAQGSGGVPASSRSGLLLLLAALLTASWPFLRPGRRPTRG